MKKAIIIASLFCYVTFAPSLEIKHVSAKQLKCLADNIYYEARGEPVEGQLAVALVTLNRAKGSSICEEVYKPHQFSWTSKPKKITEPDEWEKSYALAYKAMTSITNTFEATHYHSIKVNPHWKLKRIDQIGNHIFYKET